MLLERFFCKIALLCVSQADVLNSSAVVEALDGFQRGDFALGRAQPAELTGGLPSVRMGKPYFR